ncbi:hypothetical protein AB6A23_19375 [Paenibacillus tarimensis]
MARFDGEGLSEETTVYNDPGYINMLQWSGDGQSLIFAAERTSGSDVFRFRFAT